MFCLQLSRRSALTFGSRRQVLSRGFASRIGFVGLGNMGAPMARNLLMAGNSVTVFDMNVEAVNNLKQSGATTAATVAELASNQDVIVTMLPNADIVRGVFQDLLPNSSQNTLFIDSSTIDPACARELASQAQGLGHEMADAPVSGGIVGAQNATLTFMVGSTPAVLERARPVLSAMGKNIAHCGDNGAGQIAKLCNNLVLAISMLGVAEGMNLGVKLGANPKVLASIMNTSSGRCWSSDTYNPCPGVIDGVPASRDYNGGFAVNLMLKDLGLARAAAADSDAVLPLGDHAAELYSEISRVGYGSKDFGVVYQLLSQLSRSQVGSDGVFASQKED